MKSGDMKLFRKDQWDNYQTFIERQTDNTAGIYNPFQGVGAGKACQKQSNISSIKTGQK